MMILRLFRTSITLVGGTRKEAKLSEIRIYRQKPGATGQEIITLNYAAIRKNEQPDIFLKPYDVIEVSDNGIFAGKTWLGILLDALTGGVRNTLARPVPL